MPAQSAWGAVLSGEGFRHAALAEIEPIERQFTALKAGNIEAAYQETSEAFHQGTPIGKFSAFVDQFPILKDAAEHSFASRSVENGVGKVSGTLTSSTGGVMPVEYRLVKENEAWKILNIDLTVH